MLKVDATETEAYLAPCPIAYHSIQVNHNTTLNFPSIVLCNENDFRMTKAEEMGLFDFIGKFLTSLFLNLIVMLCATCTSTRPIAISRVLRVFSDGRTDRPTDRQTDRPTERLIESRARD